METEKIVYEANLSKPVLVLLWAFVGVLLLSSLAIAQGPIGNRMLTIK